MHRKTSHLKEKKGGTGGTGRQKKFEKKNKHNAARNQFLLRGGFPNQWGGSRGCKVKKTKHVTSFLKDKKDGPIIKDKKAGEKKKKKKNYQQMIPPQIRRARIGVGEKREDMRVCKSVSSQKKFNEKEVRFGKNHMHRQEKPRRDYEKKTKKKRGEKKRG